jgi:hypothetical protein
MNTDDVTLRVHVDARHAELRAASQPRSATNRPMRRRASVRQRLRSRSPVAIRRTTDNSWLHLRPARLSTGKP